MKLPDPPIRRSPSQRVDHVETAPPSASPSMVSKNSPLDLLRKRHRVAVPSRSVGHDRGSDRAGDRKIVGRATTRAGLSADDERTLKLILAEPMDYIDSPEFAKPDAERRIYEELPEIQKPDVSWYRPLMDDLTPYGDRSRERNRARPQSTILLTGAQERILFLKYNYARRRINLIQQEVRNGMPTLDQAREILRWNRIATAYREQIAETNLALVLAMAKRTRMSEVDFADLVSEGNMALLRSVDKFDCGRGFKFSTYACRAIIKAFSRQGIKFSKYRQRFPTDFDPALEKSNHLETLRATHERESAEEVKHIVLTNRADLTDVERTVINHRFALETGANQPPLTLEQVGQIIGVTKERVRQIQNKALEKLRLALEAVRPAPLPEADPGPRPSEN